MVALAKGGICPILGFAPISNLVIALEQSKGSNGATIGYGFPKSQVPKILTVAVTYYCPKYKKDLAALKSGKQAAAAPTTTTHAPTLTGPQVNAIAEAKQYLQTQAFSQQGLIDQLDSPAGGQFSVNDATFAVSVLNVDWNAEAVQSAKEYLKSQPFSCQDLIDQLDSSAGGEFTVAEATYGAQQAGAC